MSDVQEQARKDAAYQLVRVIAGVVEGRSAPGPGAAILLANDVLGALQEDVSLLMTAIGGKEEQRDSCAYWSGSHGAALGLCQATANCPGPHATVQRWLTDWQEVNDE